MWWEMGGSDPTTSPLFPLHLSSIILYKYLTSFVCVIVYIAICYICIVYGVVVFVLLFFLLNQWQKYKNSTVLAYKSCETLNSLSFLKEKLYYLTNKI